MSGGGGGKPSVDPPQVLITSGNQLLSTSNAEPPSTFFNVHGKTFFEFRAKKIFEFFIFGGFGPFLKSLFYQAEKKFDGFVSFWLPQFESQIDNILHFWNNKMARLET